MNKKPVFRPEPHHIDNLEYNTERDHLILPEYGRHFQRLANSIRKMEDPEEQRVYIEKTIDLIIQLFPQSKTVDNYREKLWHDIYYMADFDLKVLPPSGIRPTLEDQMLKPSRLRYPQHEVQYRHYGYNVEKLIDKAIGMEEGPVRDEFAQVIGTYMKLSYRIWSKEHFVSDDVIKQDLQHISGGQLNIDEDAELDANMSNQTKKRFANPTSVLAPPPKWKKKKKPAPVRNKNRNINGNR